MSDVHTFCLMQIIIFYYNKNIKKLLYIFKILIK